MLSYLNIESLLSIYQYSHLGTGWNTQKAQPRPVKGAYSQPREP